MPLTDEQIDATIRAAVAAEGDDDWGPESLNELWMRTIARPVAKAIERAAIESIARQAPVAWMYETDAINDRQSDAGWVPYKTTTIHRNRAYGEANKHTPLYASPIPVPEPVASILFQADSTLALDVRQALGEALTDTLLAMAAQPDWNNSHEVDRVIDTMQGVLWRFVEEAAETALPPPEGAQREALTQVLDVAVKLLDECIGPLEVSAAIIESDDSDQMETLIERVKKFVTDAASRRARALLAADQSNQQEKKS